VLPIVYHKGPGVKKSGPKGPIKIKGPVLEAIYSEIDSRPSLTSEAIAERVYRKTGMRVSDSRIRQLWHQREKRPSSRRGPAGEASRPTLP
jgi:hypothetical protein